jgi:DNA-directed RNA polymerase beta subunit
LFIDLIQSNFSPGKIQRIINEEPSLQFYSKAFGKFDAGVEEGINSTTQRQMQFAQLMEMRSAGIEIPQDLLIRASTLQNKEELVEAIGQNQQQQQQIQEMQMQFALEKEKAEIKDLESRAEANAGLGLERASRVQENRALAVERLAESQKDRDLGTLHLVKAMKELEGMDIEQVARLMELAKTVQSIESPQEIEEEASVKTPNVEELAVMAQGEK